MTRGCRAHNVAPSILVNRDYREKPGSEVAGVPLPSRVPHAHLTVERNVAPGAEARVTARSETRASGEAGMAVSARCMPPSGERVPAPDRRKLSIRSRIAVMAAHVLVRRWCRVLYRLRGRGWRSANDADHQHRGQASKG